MVQTSRRPGPHQINAFAHVVREGTISAAARKLGVTQSAVSQHLKKLEDVTGTKLILQTRDGLELTKTGEELFALADHYLSADQMITEKFADFAQLRRGYLSIIANAPQPALRLIADYAKVFPDVEIDFTLYDWTSAMRLLGSRKVDIGVVAAPRRSPEFLTHQVGALRYTMYMRRDDPLAHRNSVSLADLADRRLILPEAGSLTQRLVSKAFAKHDIAMASTIKMTSFPLVKEAILHGVGIGPFLEHSATSEEGLVALPIDEMPETHPINLVAHRNKANLHLIQSFFRVAEDTFMSTQPK